MAIWLVMLTGAASYTGSDGRRWVNGKKVRITSDEEADFYRNTGRFAVTEVTETGEPKVQPLSRREVRARDRARKEPTAAPAEPVDASSDKPEVVTQGDEVPPEVDDVDDGGGGVVAGGADDDPPPPPETRAPKYDQRILNLAQVDPADATTTQLRKLAAALGAEVDPAILAKGKLSKADKEVVVGAVQRRQTEILAEVQAAAQG